ncbi:chemotaxis protein [Flocculibacter collagenilyticus]|uniref:chemotaxis protein n=1 Tax=Flocculibacter collagenilyticus TaxID=2744479 RepID=UPI0018F38D40|nr:chemotaxis protein [Flocculibacter collagenilyticus]
MNVELSPDQKDCLQEIVNLATGQASNTLARYLSALVNINVPAMRLVKPTLLYKKLALEHDAEDDSALIEDKKHFSTVSQSFLSDEIRGDTLLFFPNVDFTQLPSAEHQIAPDDNHNILLDVSAIINTAFLNTFSEQLEQSFSYNAPRLHQVDPNQPLQQLNDLLFTWDYALEIEIAYQVEKLSFNCRMVLLFPNDAIKRIQLVLDDILSDYDE